MGLFCCWKFETLEELLMRIFEFLYPLPLREYIDGDFMLGRAFPLNPVNEEVLIMLDWMDFCLFAASFFLSRESMDIRTLVFPWKQFTAF